MAQDWGACYLLGALAWTQAYGFGLTPDLAVTAFCEMNQLKENITIFVFVSLFF